MKFLKIAGVVLVAILIALASAAGALAYVNKMKKSDEDSIEEPVETKVEKKTERRQNAQRDKPMKAPSFIAPLDIVLTNLTPRTGIEASAFIQLRISAEVSSEAAVKVIANNHYRITNAILLAASETTKDDWTGTQIPATLKILTQKLTETIADQLDKDDYVYSIIVQDFAIDTEKFFLGEDIRNGYRN